MSTVDIMNTLRTRRSAPKVLHHAKKEVRMSNIKVNFIDVSSPINYSCICPFFAMASRPHQTVKVKSISIQPKTQMKQRCVHGKSPCYLRARPSKVEIRRTCKPAGFFFNLRNDVKKGQSNRRSLIAKWLARFHSLAEP